MKDPKSILITGASSGIGEALACYYAQEGVFLALSGRNSDRLTAVAVKCRLKGANVQTAIVDVCQAESMREWIKGEDQEHPFDLVIANAGISGGTAGKTVGEPVLQARQIFDVNVTGVFNTIEPILDDMLSRQRGQIAIMSSLAGYRGWPGAPAYSASKGAVRFYGEGLRGALRDSGVQINVICPGFVTSRMTDQNDFKMPFKMPAEKAAKIIATGLAKNKGRISFPFQTLFLSWLVSIMPDAMAQALLSATPSKGAILPEDIP